MSTPKLRSKGALRKCSGSFPFSRIAQARRRFYQRMRPRVHGQSGKEVAEPRWIRFTVNIIVWLNDQVMVFRRW